MNSQRQILHIDMDAFFAAVEISHRPELQGRPVIIGAQPGTRGVVSTASYEARQYGVHSAMPINQAYKLCPHGIYLKPDMAKYDLISQGIMAILKKFSPLVEIVSIDEAFLDCTGCHKLWGPPPKIAALIKTEILNQYHLTCSIGIAPNKFIAKIASDYQKPNGLTEIAPGTEASFLAPLPLAKMWGLGRKTIPQLKSLGINTIGDLLTVPQPMLATVLKEQTPAFLKLAQGLDSRPVMSQSEPCKSISNEITFKHDINASSIILKTLHNLCLKVGKRMRQKHLLAQTITLKLRRADFTTITRSKTVDPYLFTDQDIWQTLSQIYNKLDNNQAVRLVGVGLSNFIDSQQLSFLSHTQKLEQLNRQLDQLKAKYGDNIIKPLSLF
jgi:nucleotidyltransferase/DNA polymerase involved in DNA repair